MEQTSSCRRSITEDMQEQVWSPTPPWRCLKKQINKETKRDGGQVQHEDNKKTNKVNNKEQNRKTRRATRRPT